MPMPRLFRSKAVPVKLLGPTAKAFVQDSSRREKSRDSSDLDLWNHGMPYDSYDAIKSVQASFNVMAKNANLKSRVGVGDFCITAVVSQCLRNPRYLLQKLVGSCFD